MPTRYVLGWRLIWGVTLHQLLRYVFVEDFLHGQGDDDFVAALEERFDLLPMNLVAADVRKLILNPAKTVRASLRRLPRFACPLLARRGAGGDGEPQPVRRF
jgi:hypothetical protein